MANQHLIDRAAALFAELEALTEPERIDTINGIKRALHQHSPFLDEPVDCVLWEPADRVTANDYNPNTVAPPEMRLLETSILADGFTQPIVAHDDGEQLVVVDGFHRNRVGKESAGVRERVRGYLPIVQIRAGQEAAENRMASTIRHNRARGKHGVEPLTDIVAYLARKNWSDAKIAREIGMDLDEVLRYRQISGLVELFADEAFSEAWTV